MVNIIKEIDNIDDEMRRFRERQKMKIEKIFDESIWELLAALGYTGSKSKASALPALPPLIEQVEKWRKSVPAEVEQQEVENAPENAPAPTPSQVY